MSISRINVILLTERWLEKYAKKLIGRTEMEDALKKLDNLTQEEARMAAAQNLKATHAVDERVRGVGHTVDAVEKKVASTDDHVGRVDKRVVTVDDRVRVVDKNLMQVIAGALNTYSRPGIDS